jgi:hypothetical protein
MHELEIKSYRIAPIGAQEWAPSTAEAAIHLSFDHQKGS